MQGSIAESPSMRVARLIAIGVRGLLAGMALSACSATSNDKLTFFADPGAFDYHSCDQIAALRAHWSSREQELKQLMARSEQSTGGAVINVIAYQADYTQAQEQVRLLAAAARSKNCSTPENWRSNSSFR
jgi:ABC-type glycerol-3-phosphate transport system substrate-binding protein